MSLQMNKGAIDKKFLFIILGTVAVAAVVIAGLVYMKTRSDPIRHVRRGETYMAQGEYKDAHGSFLRAIGKDSFKPQFYDLAVESLLKITPQTQEDADTRYGTHMGLLFKKSEIVPADEAIIPIKQAIKLNRATIEGIEGQPGNSVLPAFERISMEFQNYADLPESDADKAWVLNHIHEHEWRYARYLPESEWEDTEDRLKEMVAMDPTSAYNQYAFLRAKFDRAIMNLSGARRREGERELNKFNEDLQRAREEAGQAPEFDFLEFENSYRAYLAGRDSKAPQNEILVGIIEKFNDDDDRIRFKELFMRSLLLAQEQILIDQPEHLIDSISTMLQMRRDIAKRLYEIDPNDSRNLMLFITTRKTEELEVARQLASELVNTPMPTVGVNARLYNSTRLQAANFNFKAEYTKNSVVKAAYQDVLSDPGSSQEEKVEAEAQVIESLARVEEAYAVLAAIIDESGSINPTFKLQVDLDLAHAQEDWDKALRHVNNLVAQGVRMDSAKMLVAADVAMRAGDFGAAARFVEDVIAIRPDLRSDPGYALIRARLAMSSGEFEKAMSLAGAVVNQSMNGKPVTSQEIAQAKEIIRSSERRANPDAIIQDQLSGVFAAALRAGAEGDSSKQRMVYANALFKIENTKARTDLEELQRDRMLVRLLSAYSVFEATDADGDPEAAKQLAAQLNSIDPENQIGLLIGEIAGKDVVESLRALSVLTTSEDPSLQEERFWFALRNEERLLKQQLLRASQDPGAFSSSEFETIKSDLELVIAEAELVEANISERSNESSTMLRYNADKALSEGRFADAMEAHDAIVALDGETWRTVLIKARILMADMKLESAADVLADAIANGQSNAIVLRHYGRVLIELGQVKDGIDSLATAYQDSPGDAQTALDYSTALYRSGNADDALRVLRRSAAVGRTNAEYLRRWLALESQIGSSHIALQERIRIWKGNPALWENGVELGKLLISADVDWRSVRDPKTERLMFNEREWVRLSKKEQNTYSDQVRRQRGDQSEEIFVELMSRPNASPIVFMARADTLESLGQRDRALEILKERVTGDDASVGPIERSIMAVDVARRHMEVAEFDEANIWIEKSRELQPEGNPIGDKSLISLWQVKGNPKELAVAIQNVIELDQTEGALRNRDMNTRLLIRALLDSEQHEEANELYAREFKDSEDIKDLILLGALYVELARNSFIIGEKENAQIAFNNAVETFNKVAEADPGSIEPPLQLARLYELRHQWIGNEKDIEIAIEQTRNALANVQTSWIAQELLCVLLIRDEQLEAASGALEEFLARVPDHEKARFMLVRMYESMDKQDRAVELCQEAVDRDPYSIAWNVRLGKLRGEQGRFNDAAGAFLRLYDMTQDPTVARFYVDAKLRRDPPDHQAVLAFARSNVKLIRDDPYLAGAYAATLAHAGNTEKAFTEIEESYVRFRDAGASAMAMQQLISWLPRILENTGDRKDIAEQSEELINTFSNGNPDLGSRLILASAWVKEGADGQSRAIDHLRVIAAQDNGSHDLGVQPISSLAGLLIESGDCEGALAEFQRALNMQPRDVTLLNNLAYTRAICDDDLEQAMHEINLASDIDPLNASVLDTLGFIYLKKGEYQAADAALRRSLNRREDATALIHLAEVRIVGKKYDEAETLLKTAGDLKPSKSEQLTISELIRRIEAEKGSR